MLDILCHLNFWQCNEIKIIFFQKRLLQDEDKNKDKDKDKKKSEKDSMFTIFLESRWCKDIKYEIFWTFPQIFPNFSWNFSDIFRNLENYSRYLRDSSEIVKIYLINFRKFLKFPRKFTNLVDSQKVEDKNSSIEMSSIERSKFKNRESESQRCYIHLWTKHLSPVHVYIHNYTFRRHMGVAVVLCHIYFLVLF